MSVLTIAPTHNAKGKRDVTGAFLPEAKRFWTKHGGELVQFDNHAHNATRRRQVHDAILRTYDLRTLAIFCHGWMDGIQTGHRRGNLDGLADCIDIACEHNELDIILYCCSTAQGGAGGDGGFADMLRDFVQARGVEGVRVWAHTTKGHTTRNPYLRLFDASDRGHGGRWVVEPGSAEWPMWKRAMRGELRFTFWQYEAGEVRM